MPYTVFLQEIVRPNSKYGDDLSCYGMILKWAKVRKLVLSS